MLTKAEKIAAYSAASKLGWQRRRRRKKLESHTMLIVTADTLLHHYPARELLECANREVRQRRVRYANRVLTGRMTQHQADSEIDKMSAIAEILAELASKERLL